MAFWRGLGCDSRIFLAAGSASVMTVMLHTLAMSMAGMSPMRIAMISASVGVIFMVWM